jgi:hypothetical protein
MFQQNQPIQDPVLHVLPRNEARHWHSLVIYPKHAHFAFQKKSEKVYILTRKHFITNLGWIAKTIFFIFLPFILLLLGEVILPQLFSQLINSDTIFLNLSVFNVIAVIVLYYTLVFTYAWGSFIGWFFNVYLITNERMIHTEFKLMTGSKVSEAPLDNIVDISQENYGFLPSLFNYGNVKVQTATAMKSRFDFHQIPDPSWFRSVLYELVKIDTEGEP